ncbi:MAG: M48 family peptidase, partial [Deltaproteobacteria bacterium]|nr:M48 family peptidase [Deltaproteobacteria bacterium]
MNTIALIILLAIILDLILHLFSDALNLKMLQSKVPDAFRGIFDPESYRKSQDYLKVNTSFGWISTIFNTMVMLLFWFAGGFAMLDNWARSLEQGP